MSIRVGVDIGGTFTDFCAFDEKTNTVHTMKVPSTPERPGAEVMEGLRALRSRYGVEPTEITYFTHGTTVGVNTVIQRKGAKLCLFATERFVDVLEVGRLKMPDPYDLHSRRPPSLVPRERVLPIVGRIGADGCEDQPLDEVNVIDALNRARGLGAEAIVIALINSYRNPAHEHAVKMIVEREAPGLPVFCSHDVWSIIREYERTITAVIHGYVQPRVSHYLTSLQHALADAGVPAQALVTKSNGGVMTAELGKTACAQMILSGTAAGVIGASYISQLSGFDNTMSLDIGGTSVDVAFIQGGNPQYGVGEMIGEFPIYIPSVAVTSIGAGGGSIAWVDPLGVLKVGPESAGSVPGPACYGKGGERPTITDAFAVLGYIGQDDLGYGVITVDREKAHAAVATVAAPMKITVEAAAEAIINVAVSGMYMEVSKLTSRYGIEPRDYVMQAFGGAGPMLAGFLANDLGMKNVLIPPTPGVLSALGGLIADVKSDFIRTTFLDLGPEASKAVCEAFAELEREAEVWLRDQQGYDGERHVIYSADMRYRGQSYEIETIFEPDSARSGDVAALEAAFHAEHQRVYGYADQDAIAQVVNLRLVIVGASAKPEIRAEPVRPGRPEPGHHSAVYIGGTTRLVPSFNRAALRPGHTFSGPAIVTQSDATCCIPADFEVEVDTYGNLVLHRAPVCALEPIGEPVGEPIGEPIGEPGGAA